MRLLEQKISHHPLFSNIERTVVVRGVNVDAEFGQIVLNAEVHYFDSSNENQDVTSSFKSKLKDWIVSNKEFTTVRDAEGSPVPNPNYREVPAEGEDDRRPEEIEPYLKRASFDYFFEIIKESNVSLIQLLRLHIQHNDEIQFFDNILK